MILDFNNLFPPSGNADLPRGPLPRQLEFFKAANDMLPGVKARYIRYLGGVGCLEASEPVETTQGPVPITRLTPEHQVLTVGRPVSGIVAFPAGRGSLYRVVHAHGEFVASGSHLVFCSDHKYRRVDELLGHALLYCASQAQTIPECTQPESPVDAPHCLQTAADWLDRCLAYCHQYGPLPPQVAGIARSFAPSLAGAPESCRPVWRRVCELLGALTEQELGNSHRGQLLDLLSSFGSLLRSLAPELALADQASASPSAQSSQASPVSEQYLQTIMTHLLRQLDPDNYTFDPPSSSPSEVISITEVEKNTTFWDVHVPGTECYQSKSLIHHNSGKSLIGCITVLYWAIRYPGDYLIGRFYYPELRDTTLKTFLDIVPKDLLLEHRVADGIVRIKNIEGGYSNVFFRAMEDPDKHRSLNLNGFYLDESSQMTEEAFLLLITRLRGKHVRKGILTTNSDGRSWGWKYFVDQTNLSDKAKPQFYNIVAPTTENKHLATDYVESMLDTYSEERIKREVLADENLFEGAIYPEFSHKVHVIPPFDIPKDWTIIVGADHGFTNPSAWAYGALDYDGNVYMFHEYYESGKLIEELCQRNKAFMEEFMKGRDPRCFQGIHIDPSIRATRAQTGISDYDTYLANLPTSWPLVLANNEVSAGIDKVKSYLKINEKSLKPKLFVFNNCKNLIQEIGEYRWEPMGSGSAGRMNLKERPRKYNDHITDALRYMIMALPELPKIASREEMLNKLPGLTGSLQREMHKIKNNLGRDPMQWE